MGWGVAPRPGVGEPQGLKTCRTRGGVGLGVWGVRSFQQQSRRGLEAMAGEAGDAGTVEAIGISPLGNCSAFSLVHDHLHVTSAGHLNMSAFSFCLGLPPGQAANDLARNP